MRKILARPFFDRPTLTVAKQLLGKYLVRNYRGKELAVMITEVEAYDGPLDLASHASHGRTPRAAIMFGDPGNFYIFFTYGIHWMANVVTGPKEYPAAILLRSGIYEDPKTGEKKMIKGPARLTKFLKIDGRFNKKIAAKKTGLWFEDRGAKIALAKIIASKRIGIEYAGPIWANKKYNFALKYPI